MTTATIDTPNAKELLQNAGLQHVYLRGVAWKTYKQLAHDLEGERVFMTYADGILEIMTTSQQHESGKSVLAFMLELYALEKDIPILRCGSMTCQREDLEKGFEPDACYYVKNERRIRGLKKLDFKKNPAPDLAVEIEVSRRLSDRKAIYAAFGVPELWLYDNKTLQVLHLKSDGYAAAAASKSFPELPIKAFERFLAMRSEKSEHEAVKSFRDWLRKS